MLFHVDSQCLEVARPVTMGSFIAGDGGVLFCFVYTPSVRSIGLILVPSFPPS